VEELTAWLVGALVDVGTEVVSLGLQQVGWQFALAGILMLGLAFHLAHLKGAMVR
jgi:hypothetical protein